MLLCFTKVHLLACIKPHGPSVIGLILYYVLFPPVRYCFITFCGTTVDPLKEILMKEVSKYVCLYNSSSQQNKSSQMAANSWKQISTDIDLDVANYTK